MRHDTRSNTFQACQVSQDHCARFGLSTLSVRRPPRPAVSRTSENRLFRKNIPIRAESADPPHLPDSPPSQTSPLVQIRSAGPPPEVLTMFCASLARVGFARILNNNPICLELLWNSTSTDGTQTHIFYPRFLLLAGAIKQTGFVTTTWWKNAESELLTSCPTCKTRYGEGDNAKCIHETLFPQVSLALGATDHSERLAACATASPPLDRLTSDFLRKCADRTERVTLLSTFGKKSMYLAVLSTADAQQYGLEDRPWAVCTVTHILARGCYEVKCQAGRCVTGHNKMVRNVKDMKFVCGHAQAVLSQLNFRLNESTSASDSDGADPFADWDTEDLDHQEISEGVHWSETKGAYVPAPDCSQSEIPRLCLLGDQLDAIRRRQRLDDVLRDDSTGDALETRNGWLLGKPLRASVCRECRSDLLSLPRDKFFVASRETVIHSIAVSVAHQLEVWTCETCGVENHWLPEQAAVHMISNGNEGGKTQSVNLNSSCKTFIGCLSCD